jgi:hypothetical protein
VTTPTKSWKEFIKGLPLGPEPTSTVPVAPHHAGRGASITGAPAPGESTRSAGPGAVPADTPAPIAAVRIDSLPNGVVTGGNLLQFPDAATPDLRASIALSLLAAQRVAGNDPAVQSPDEWIERHNTVLENLNWISVGGGVVTSTFDSINVAVNQAIIPFLTAAFGPAVAAGSLIITALNQLQAIDTSSPWITLFDRQSQRFNITEYQFSVVEIQGDHVQLKIAAARFDASYGKTQVLFFKITQEHASFELGTGAYSSQVSLQEQMNAALKSKLAAYTDTYISSLPV